MNAVTTFFKRVGRSASRRITNFFRGCVDHTETIVILGLSSIGLTSLLSEIPFKLAVPMWVELPLVIPVLSVMLITMLVKSAELRSAI